VILLSLLRSLEEATRDTTDTPAERLTRMADVLTRHAVLTSDRDVAHLARLIATDLRDIVGRVEAT
jgi:hypothetical protein